MQQRKNGNTSDSCQVNVNARPCVFGLLAQLKYSAVTMFTLLQKKTFTNSTDGYGDTSSPSIERNQLPWGGRAGLKDSDAG